jgi:hypothetical protein
MMMRSLLSLAIALSLMVGPLVSEGDARPRPMPKDRLVKSSKLILTGKVISTRLTGITKDKRSTTRTYTSEIRVKNITKGKRKRGDVIEIRWNRKSWKPGVSRPRCDTPHPSFTPCEQVKIHVWGWRVYSLVHWSGKRSIKTSGKLGNLPKRKGKSTLCKR